MAYETNIITQITTDPTLQPFLPFFFVLAVVYGMLSIANIFKNNKTGGSMKSVNFIIALVFAFFAAGYQPFVSFFLANFGLVLWAFIIIFFIAFVLEAIGLRGKHRIEKGKEDVPIMMGGVIILLLATIGFSYMSEFDIPIVGTENFMMIVGIILLLLVFYYAYEFGRGQKQPQ